MCVCVCVHRQDFYSHSNWVELGYTEPYINLIRPELPLEDLAGVFVFYCCHAYRRTNESMVFYLDVMVTERENLSLIGQWVCVT